MTWEMMFRAANMLALLSWTVLLLLPRWPMLVTAICYGTIVLLAIAYAALIFVFFFRVEAGGFGSLAQVKALFASDPVLLAGWLHYLCFDLFVGLWIARRCDASGISRVVQAPMLAATFMFGPLGLLLHDGVQAAAHRSATRKAV